MKHCCDVFPIIKHHFEWMSLDKEILLMPHITINETKYRINHCPSCGKEIRDIQVPIKEMER
jgi:hypothetical protein